MKKFFILLGIFALIVIFCDFTVGFVGEKLVDNAVGGDTGRKCIFRSEPVHFSGEEFSIVK